MAWTVLELVKAAAAHLASAGSEEARLDAELLLGRVLGKERLDLYVGYDMPVADEDRAAYRELVRRRARGEPVAYILGIREFHGLEFQVDRRCLVPRPETEHLVDEAAAFLGGRPAAAGDRVADVGTGSGCIAVTLARRFPGTGFVATDRSAGALEVARANAGRLAPASAITFLEGDLVAPLRSLAPFVLILSNPPYIPESDRADLPRDVREHEPGMALFSGEDALGFHGRLLAEGWGLLGEGGAMILELPAGHGREAADLVGRVRPGAGCRIVRDLAGHDRVLVVRRPEA